MQPKEQPSPQNLQLIIKQILQQNIYKHEPIPSHSQTNHNPNPPSSKPQPQHPYTSQLFQPVNTKKYNIKYLKSCLVADEQLSKRDLLEMIAKFNSIVNVEFQENLVKITGSVMIVGDLHGQFFDFVKILGIIGAYYGDVEEFCGKQSLLFLGDYVDRGLYSIQVLTLIMALKINNPKSVFCLRGNHECRSMTSVYNFKAEVLVKYDRQVYDKFMQTFDLLPLAALINNSYFCVHGGITDQLVDMGKINGIDRFQEIPDQGAFCDFMWADPMPKENQKLHEDSQFNNVRMCSIFFGKDLTNTFINTNHLKSIIRAHEVFPQGFQRKDWNTKNKTYPSVITIFSAPNYCGIYNNLGAVLHIKVCRIIILRQDSIGRSR